jgi:hypothetical protein
MRIYARLRRCGSDKFVTPENDPSRSRQGFANCRIRIRVTTDYLGTGPWDVGLCLDADDPEFAGVGTLIDVPKVSIIPSNWYKRVRVFLLSDASITTTEASKVALDSLALGRRGSI